MIATALGIWPVVRQIIDIIEMLGLLLWCILYATWSRILVKDKSAVSSPIPLSLLRTHVLCPPRWPITETILPDFLLILAKVFCTIFICINVMSDLHVLHIHTYIWNYEHCMFGSVDANHLKYRILLLCNRWPEHTYDDVIKWKYFPRYWPFVQGIHRPPVNSPYKGQWRGALMFLWYAPE